MINVVLLSVLTENSFGTVRQKDNRSTNMALLPTKFLRSILLLFDLATFLNPSILGGFSKSHCADLAIMFQVLYHQVLASILQAWYRRNRCRTKSPVKLFCSVSSSFLQKRTFTWTTGLSLPLSLTTLYSILFALLVLTYKYVGVARHFREFIKLFTIHASELDSNKKLTHCCLSNLLIRE